MIKEAIRGWLFPDVPANLKKKEILDLHRYSTTTKEAGLPINFDTVAKNGDVFSCVRILSTAIGQLPIVLNRKVDNVLEPVEDTVLANIFTVQPNFYQTTQEWLEQCISCLALSGNFYAEIVRNRYGNIAQIIPFYQQNSVDVIMLTDGSIQYTYTTNSSETGLVVKQTFAPFDILHIKMNSYDGYIGTSILTHARKELGIALATEKHTASIFENDATPRMVLESDQTFGDDLTAFNRMRDSWNEVHKGSGNSGKTALLEFGFKARPLQMTPVDSQLIEQRILSRGKIATMFGIPLHRLNDASGSKYASVEQNNKSFYTDTLAPYITRIESHLNLLMPRGFKIKIDDTHFMRGDSATQTEIISKQVSMGLITINEGRKALGFQPVEGGEVFATTTNNLMFGTWAEYEKPELPDPNAKPTPAENNNNAE
ncbi:phage portal protein, HK97 family [Moritella sp. PE36]|uniref:phage portal protein n=1 Tax=Moritella sp. PE36 TaxID=58051 RepID=UPI000156914F|nr:phage portal protein [Moritella sp. PE36]EDM66150.1 phage portal protein, HK97 family [Moritella sp. PE36]